MPVLAVRKAQELAEPTQVAQDKERASAAFLGADSRPQGPSRAAAVAVKPPVGVVEAAEAVPRP